MKSTITSLAAALAFSLAPLSLEAIPLSGSLDLAWNTTLNSSSLASATGITGAGSTGIAAASLKDAGYISAGAAGTAVSMRSYFLSTGGPIPGTPIPFHEGSAEVGLTTQTFNWTVPAITNPLWSFTYLGNAYQFDLASFSVVAQSGSFLLVVGQGAVYVGGYDPSPGDWAFTMTSSGGETAKVNFGFQSLNVVPDGGSTAMLLGLAFLGLGAAARLRTV